MAERGVRVPKAAVVLVLLALLGIVAGLTWTQWRDADGAPASQPSALLDEPVDYVALGDSYTAGPLIPDIREDAPGCFRSTNNYPAYLADLLDVATYRDASCSGADTSDVTGPQPLMFGNRAGPQLSALSAQTDLVTVGLGGNDFGLFGSLAGGCGGSSKADATPCQDLFGHRLALDALRIRDSLGAALQAIGERAPDADVFVVGYPRLLPETGSCRAAGFTVADAAWAQAIAERLNGSLRQAAEQGGATYVDLYPASTGHDICAGREAWVNGRRTILGRAAAYHPFLLGMRETARAVYEAVTGEPAPPLDGPAAPPTGSMVLGG